MQDSLCPEFEQCADRRTLDAQYRGTVLATLESIKQSISELKAEMTVNRKDIKDLYFRIGLISGGTSLVVSLVVSIVVTAMRR